jgi:rare lipoprotein A (peptidoglycan hydrolase)
MTTLRGIRGRWNIRMAFLCVAVIVIVGACSRASTAFGDNSSRSNHGAYIIGLASWYSEADRGIRKSTANMERFSDRKDACAIWSLPFNTLIKVTNLINGKSIIVRVNDRGPSKDLVRQGRVIDLTRGAFSKIAELGDGLIPIKIVCLQ